MDRVNRYAVSLPDQIRDASMHDRDPSIHPSIHLSSPIHIYPTIANLKQALLHAARLVDLRTSRQRGERGPPHHLSKAAGAAWVASGGAGRQGAARGGEGRRGAVRGGEGR